MSECIQLGLKIASALEFLHGNDLIHRDIKPSNILFVDDAPKLADFGLVSRADARHTSLGTQGFSPSVGADSKSGDLYGLGKVLYELTTGMDRHAFPELPGDVHTFAELPLLVGLNEILLKACEQEPRSRYQSAAEFSEDLRSLLQGRPVAFRRALERRVRLYGGISLVAVLFLVLGGVALTKIHLSEKTSTLRWHNLLTAEGMKQLDANDAAGSLPWLLKARSLATAQSVKVDQLRLEIALRDSPILEQLWQHDQSVNSVEFSADGRKVASAGKDRIVQVRDCDTGKLLFAPLLHNADVRLACFSPDGRTLLCVTGDERTDGEAILWDVGTGSLLAKVHGHKGAIRWGCFNGQGSRFATAGSDGKARVWDAHTGKPTTDWFIHGDQVRFVQFHPDGTKILTASWDGTARVWDCEKQTEVLRLDHEDAYVRHASYSADGLWIASSCDNGCAQVWNASDGTKVTPSLRHQGIVRRALFSPDRKKLVTASDDKTVKVWGLPGGDLLLPPLKHPNAAPYICFGKDGHWIFSGSDEGKVRAWDASTGESVMPVFRQGGIPTCLAASSDGKRLVTAGSDHLVRVWRLDTHTARTIGNSGCPPMGSAVPGFISQKGGEFLQLPSLRNGQVVSQEGGLPHSIILEHAANILDASFSPNEQLVAISCESAQATIWEIASGKKIASLQYPSGAIRSIVFHQDGVRVATGGDGGITRVWTTNGVQVLEFARNTQVHQVDFSPDGQLLVTCGGDFKAHTPGGPGSVEVWNLAKARPLFPAISFGGRVWHSAFSPNSLYLATAQGDGTARVWNLKTGQPASQALHHDDEVIFAAFSPEGTRLVTTSWDNSARIWNWQDEKPVAIILPHNGSVLMAAFDGSGRFLATACRDGMARLWDAASGQLIAKISEHRGWADWVGFSRNGTELRSHGKDQKLNVWSFPDDSIPREEMVLSADVLAGFTLGQDDHPVRFTASEIIERWDKLQIGSSKPNSTHR